MKVEYKERGNASKNGVYRIHNTINGRQYFGSCKQFKRRYLGHKNALLANRHANCFLQADFNKYGADVFVFEVVEVIEGTREDRLAREQVYVSEFFDGGVMCYNFRKDVCDTREGQRNNRSIDPTTDGRCKTPSHEVLAKRSEGIKKAMQSPEYRAACAQRAKEIRWKDHSANITVVNLSTGEIVTIEGSLRQWCLDRGLSYKSFHLLVKGKVKSSGGWCLPTA